MPAAYAESQPIRVWFMGNQLSFDEQPFIENDVTLVQFRPIFEKLGLKIEWNSDTQTITGRSDTLIIKLTIGSTSAVINDEVKQLVVAPRIINGNTMVPLRFVSEASGMAVTWTEETRVIRIFSKNDSSLTVKSQSQQVQQQDNKQRQTQSQEVSQNLSAKDENNYPSSQSQFTFRNTSWGMTKDEVKNSETAKFLDEDDTSLIYTGKVAGLNTSIFYKFINNKLVSGMYMIEEKHSNKNSYIDDYQNIKKILLDKYGKPSIDDTDWKNDLFKDSPKTMDWQSV